MLDRSSVLYLHVFRRPVSWMHCLSLLYSHHDVLFYCNQPHRSQRSYYYLTGRATRLPSLFQIDHLKYAGGGSCLRTKHSHPVTFSCTDDTDEF